MGLIRIAIVLALCAGSTAAQSFPDGPNKELFQAICSSCHNPVRVLDKAWTKSQWRDKILEMLQEEPDVTEEEREKILDYLALNFPKKVNVNKAPAAEIAATMEIPASEAASIVAYREANGSFKTLEDLKKVPGISASVTEEKKRRVVF